MRIGLLHGQRLVGDNAHGKTADARQPADHGLTVFRLVLVKLSAIHDAGDDFLHVIRTHTVSFKDSVDLFGGVRSGLCFATIEWSYRLVAQLADNRADSLNADVIVGFAIVD